MSIRLGGSRLAFLPDPDAMLHRAAVQGAGADYSIRQLFFVSALIRSLKSSGVWPTLDRLWLFASENSTQARTDLKARATASAVNSPSFSANRGYTGDALSSYLATGFIPSSAGGNMTQNSTMISAYIRTSRTAGQTYTELGATGANGTYFSPKWTDTTTFGRVNSSVEYSAAGPTNVAGMWTVSRTAAGSINVYQNGASFAAGLSLASTGLPAIEMFVFGCNSAGSLFQASGDQIAAVVLGGGLTAAQSASLSSITNTYMTAIGAAVF